MYSCSLLLHLVNVPPTPSLSPDFQHNPTRTAALACPWYYNPLSLPAIPQKPPNLAPCVPMVRATGADRDIGGHRRGTRILHTLAPPKKRPYLLLVPLSIPPHISSLPVPTRVPLQYRLQSIVPPLLLHCPSGDITDHRRRSWLA